jgi:hypothetical protein
MAKPIRGIEIFLPLEFNDGTPIPDLHYLNLQEELLRRFGGVTSVQRQFPLQGIWQNETDVYSDNIVVISAMDFGSRTQLECLRYLQRLKGRLKKEFDQLEILITVNEMLAICLVNYTIAEKNKVPLTADNVNVRYAKQLPDFYYDKYLAVLDYTANGEPRESDPAHDVYPDDVELSADSKALPWDCQAVCWQCAVTGQQG